MNLGLACRLHSQGFQSAKSIEVIWLSVVSQSGFLSEKIKATTKAFFSPDFFNVNFLSPHQINVSWSLMLCCCSLAKSCPTLCYPMDCSRPGFHFHYLPEFAQTHVHWVSDAIPPSHPLPSPCPPAFSFCQHQGLFQWVNSSHQVAKVLELQHQSFQWIFRTDFL